jgi:sulfur carrier protein
MTIEISINATPLMMPTGSTLAQAIEEFGISHLGPFAAAVNLEFIPKTHYSDTLLKNGDQIELITPITGG